MMKGREERGEVYVPYVFPRLKRYLNVLGYSARVGRMRGAGWVERGPFKVLRIVSLGVVFVLLRGFEEA